MRQSGKSAGLAVAALLAGTVLAFGQDKAPAPPPKAAVAGPKIEVVPETKDAGTVAKGQMIESTWSSPTPAPAAGARWRRSTK